MSVFFVYVEFNSIYSKKKINKIDLQSIYISVQHKNKQAFLWLCEHINMYKFQKKHKEKPHK